MLSRVVDGAKVVGLLKGFEIRRVMVSVSHLQFAVDTLFFTSRDEEKFFNLQSILQNFELVFDLSIG